MAYNYGYWLAGYIAKDPAEIVRLTSTVRAVEAAGGAVASGISSTHAPVSHLSIRVVFSSNWVTIAYCRIEC